MPPKSQNTFLIGDPSITTTDEVKSTNYMWGFDLLSDAYIINSETSEPSTLARNEPPPITARLPQEPASVPSSVVVEPKEPHIAKHKGATLQIRQLWEGTITDVNGETFAAMLNDRTNLDSPDEQAVFEFESFEIRNEDRPFIKPGSVFYWMIGTARTPAGQVRNVSEIEFSRLPVWTEASIQAASNKTATMKDWFRADAEPTAQSRRI